MRPIEESDGSVSRGWPTPDSGVFKYAESPASFDARARKRKQEKQDNGNGNGKVLAVEVKRWPTMTVSEAERGHGYQRDQQGRVYPTLTGATGAAQAWPTPTVGGKKAGGTLQEWGGSNGGNPIRHLDPELARGRLNPAWVEMLMGFPAGWTSTDGPPLRGLSTPTSHREPDPDNPTTESD